MHLLLLYLALQRLTLALQPAGILLRLASCSASCTGSSVAAIGLLCVWCRGPRALGCRLCSSALWRCSRP